MSLFMFFQWILTLFLTDYQPNCPLTLKKKHEQKKKKTKKIVQAWQINKSALVTYVSQSVMYQTLIASFHVFCRSSVVWEPKGTRLSYFY